MASSESTTPEARLPPPLYHQTIGRMSSSTVPVPHVVSPPTREELLFSEHHEDLPEYGVHDFSAPPNFSAPGRNVDGITDRMRNSPVSHISPFTDKPTVEQVMAQLKFLHAVHSLRISISAQDGLFNLNDSDIVDAKAQTDEMRKLQSEKRWAVYVARAVERFTVWWHVLKHRAGTRGARMSDFEVRGGPDAWTEGLPERVMRTRDDLPPLDILMVLHSFHLNPQAFLESCAMGGMLKLWSNGFPFAAIDSCIYENYYDPGDFARQSWEASTGLAWSNTLDPMDLEITCPHCSERGVQSMIRVPWTTFDIRKTRADRGKLTIGGGQGFADAEFLVNCGVCQNQVTHEKMRASKLTMDVRERYFGDGRLLAGTVLTLEGTLTSAGGDPHRTQHLYCNFLMKEVIAKVSKGLPLWSTVNQARLDIEATIKDDNALINASTSMKEHARNAPLTRTERIMIRRMLSRYWDTASIFAIDLVGAVIRQGTFIEKMEKLDWLHSPAATFTIETAIVKYTRFLDLATNNMMQFLVPTLDIDLAWHTAQLNPARYYAYTTSLASKTSSLMTPGKAHRPGFIDHDDKIEESRISDAFEKTQKLYQEEYGEPYSMCTCWFCEASRANASAITAAKANLKPKGTKLFTRKKSIPTGGDASADVVAAAQVAKTQTIEKQLYNPYKPTPSNVEIGPHLSTHNAVRPILSERNQQLVVLRLESQAKGIDKAKKIAAKKGRAFVVPPSVSSTASSGAAAQGDAVMKAYPYADAPFLANPNIHAELYPAGPLTADYRIHGHANCAAGSCGGQVGIGSCGHHSSASACANGAAAGCGGSAGNISSGPNAATMAVGMMAGMGGF